MESSLLNLIALIILWNNTQLHHKCKKYKIKKLYTLPSNTDLRSSVVNAEIIFLFAGASSFLGCFDLWVVGWLSRDTNSVPDTGDAENIFNIDRQKLVMLVDYVTRSKT